MTYEKTSSFMSVHFENILLSRTASNMQHAMQQ